MILISEKELSLLKKISDQELTGEDGEFILENKKLFSKYFSKMITNIQLDLGNGRYSEKEMFAYAKIEALQECITGLSDIEKAFLEYKATQE